jgi:hypothetical protein
MTSPTKRQPLPAIVCLVALCLLTALVWWRVLGRDSGDAQAGSSDCSTEPPAAPTTLPEPQAIAVSVLNSTTRNGLGGKVAAELKKDGFKVPDKASNDKPPVKGVAEIRYGADFEAGAKLLLYYVPGATLVATDSTDSQVVVSLGAQYKKLATVAEVTAALKKDGIKLTKTASGGATNASSDCASSTPSGQAGTSSGAASG